MPKDYTGSSAPYERTSSFVSLLSGWVQQGLESFFATQRIIVDLAMRQNTSAMKSIRQGLSDSEAHDSPMKVLTELAVEGTANYIEAQRVLLDMAQQENEIVMNGVKERVGDYGAAVALTNVIRRGVNTFVDMQQNFLVLASKRTQGWLGHSDNDTERGSDGLLGLAGEAMEEFIAAQKKFLDVVSEETSGPIDEKKEHVSKRNRTDLTKLAREAADSFIEAQKKLLDLAGQQVNVNMQAASRVMEMRMPIRILPVADIAGESVKSFVDAEKALVDSMMKSRTNTKEHGKKTAKSRRPTAAKTTGRRQAKASATRVKSAARATRTARPARAEVVEA